jgi:hypothetical protein
MQAFLGLGIAGITIIAIFNGLSTNKYIDTQILKAEQKRE